MLFKKGWWRWSRRSSQSANPFAALDEVFHPAAHESTLLREEKDREVIQYGSEGKPNEITVKLPKSKLPKPHQSQ